MRDSAAVTFATKTSLWAPCSTSIPTNLAARFGSQSRNSRMKNSWSMPHTLNRKGTYNANLVAALHESGDGCKIGCTMWQRVSPLRQIQQILMKKEGE